MNEIAGLAERLGADIEAVRRGIGSDPRIGYHFLYAGAGYGGSCFPKDVKALIHSARQAGVEPLLLAATQQRNDAQRRVLGERIVAHYGGQLRGKTIAVGPGLQARHRRHARGPQPHPAGSWAARARVQAHDPAAMGEARRLWGERADLRLCDTPAAALRGADALAIVTEWKAYRVPDLALLAAELADRMVFDGATCTSRPCWRATAWATPASAGRACRRRTRPEPAPGVADTDSYNKTTLWPLSDLRQQLSKQ
jgi:UDPglucose 6-dehydrogenase